MQEQKTVRLTGGRVLGPEGLELRDVLIGDGRILPTGQGTPDRSVDLRGLWVLPGIVDLHGDGFERQLAPRRGMMTDPGQGLMSVETELASCGITTAWLAQFWSWEGGMRGPRFARTLAAALSDTQPALRLDLRLQLRLERCMLDDGAEVLALVAAHGIDYVVFNDHLPHDRIAEGRTPARLEGTALKAGQSPEAFHALMKRLVARSGEVPGFVRDMARALAERGVILGSHDDLDAEDRARWGDVGLGISEFPVSRAAAAAARARGEPVIMGAPNVIRGGSHKRGGVSAQTMVADGLVEALASDYHYPSMVEAALTLVDRGVLSLARAWGMISLRPAQIMGLSDRGRIEGGARADLALLDPATRRVVGTIAGGRLVVASRALADALLA